MALPERDYYDIEDLAVRWGITIKDVRYYMEHGHVVVKTWIDKQIVKYYVAKKTVDGEQAFVKRDPKQFEGYAIIEPEIIRSVFKEGLARAIRFCCPQKESFYKVIQNELAPIIKVKDLVVSRRELIKFEQTYKVSPALALQDNMPQKGMSFPGRPSVMHKIMAEMHRRQEAGVMESSLKKEAEALLTWAQNILGTDAQLPKAKSVQNAIRDKYRTCLYAQHGITESDKMSISQ